MKLMSSLNMRSFTAHALVRFILMMFMSIMLGSKHFPIIIIYLFIMVILTLIKMTRLMLVCMAHCSGDLLII